ncbi:MAG: hypothetical protein DRJ65_16195, partial [Acidobacteria bacterium]
MSTGKEYVALTAKRILGWQTFKDHLFDYYRDEFHRMIQKVFQRGGTFAAITLAGASADKFTMAGFPVSGDDMVGAIDPEGYLLAPGERPTEFVGVDFDNENAVDFYVGIRKAVIPGSLFINPGDGLPSFDTYEEVIGYSDEPDSVVDNGDGTITFQINGITQASRDNTGRKVVVWKNQPGLNTVTDAVAVEERTVAYSATNNKITTAAGFGQSAISTTASDYTVVLLGPYVTTVDLRLDDTWTFIGIITGNAGTPSVFDIADQYVMDIPMVQLSDIVRTEVFNSRLKVDVKAYIGESGIDQIKVTKKGTPDTITFKVDEDGNVTIEGDLTVKGTTRQEDVVTVISNEIITGDLTAGDDNADDHTIQGEWTHNVTATPKFTIDGDTGRVGIGGSYSLKALEVTGDSHFTGDISVGADVLPDGARDLGAVGNKWTDLHVTNLYSGPATIDGHLIPAGINYDLGGGATQWRNLYLDGIAYLDKVNLSVNAGEGFVSHIYPDGSGTRSLGASGREWLNVYSKKLYLSETAG